MEKRVGGGCWILLYMIEPETSEDEDLSGLENDERERTLLGGTDWQVRV